MNIRNEEMTRGQKKIKKLEIQKEKTTKKNK